jgi:hypothetical protein
MAPSQDKSRRHPASPESFSVSAPPNHPHHALLAEQARKVEAEAKIHLERLTKRLELTGEQRRKLFPILARTSEGYDPALVISGLPAGAPPLLGSAGDRELNLVLEPGQQGQLIEDSLSDQALWEEIIGKLRRRLDEETPQVPAGDAESLETPAPTAGPRGRGNLFDTIDPQ